MAASLSQDLCGKLSPARRQLFPLKARSQVAVTFVSCGLLATDVKPLKTIVTVFLSIPVFVAIALDMSLHPREAATALCAIVSLASRFEPSPGCSMAFSVLTIKLLCVALAFGLPVLVPWLVFSVLREVSVVSVASSMLWSLVEFSTARVLIADASETVGAAGEEDGKANCCRSGAEEAPGTAGSRTASEDGEGGGKAICCCSSSCPWSLSGDDPLNTRLLMRISGWEGLRFRQYSWTWLARLWSCIIKE